MKKVTAIIMTVVMLATLLVMPAAAENEEKPAAHWSFEAVNDGIVTDLSGNGNGLTVNDTTYIMTDGFSGKTFDFTGTSSAYDNSQHMTADAGKLGGVLNGADGITVTAAVKKKVLASGTNFTVLRYYIDGVGVCMSVSLGAKNISIQARSASQSSAIQGLTTDEIVYPTRSKYDDGTVSGWMEIAAVFDYANKSIKVYADGILVGKAENVGFSTDTFTFSGTSTGYFGVGSRTALVDEVKIYKRAFTDGEIAESVRPVLSYDFENVSDDGVIEDLSAHKKNIAVSGDYVLRDGVQGKTVRLFTKATLPKDTIDGILYGAKVISASVWGKLTEGTLPSEAQSVIVDSNGGFNIKIETSGRVSYTMRSVSGSGYGKIETTNPVFTAGDKSWHHIYVSMDYRDYTAKIYVDGSLCASKNIPASGVQFKIHYFGVGAGNKEDTVDLCSQTSVLMDSLNIRRRALTAAELAAEVSLLKPVTAEIIDGGDSVTGECTLINSDGANLDSGADVFLAMYDKTDGKLLKCECVNTGAVAADGRKAETVTLTSIDDTSKYDYKLFVWNAGTLNPIISAVEK